MIMSLKHLREILQKSPCEIKWRKLGGYRKEPSKNLLELADDLNIKTRKNNNQQIIITFNYGRKQTKTFSNLSDFETDIVQCACDYFSHLGDPTIFKTRFKTFRINQ
jgi:hypothetical protein